MPDARRFTPGDLIQGARNTVDILLASPKRQKSVAAARQVLETEQRLGSFAVRGDDDHVYWIDGQRSKLVRVFAMADRLYPEFSATLLERYGLASAEATLVAENVRMQALREPTRAVKRFTTFTDGALYVSQYNGSAWKLDGKKITEVQNGREVLFVDDDGGAPTQVDLSAKGKLLPALVDDLSYAPATGGGLAPTEQRMLFAIWLHAIAFPELLPAKPILILIAEKGSGKSVALKRPQLICQGKAYVGGIAKDIGEEDFAVGLLRHPIALLDNVDSYVDWLPDAIARYATGGEWVRRKRYYDDQESVVKPSSFIAVTTRNPSSFYRDDVVDRLLILRLQRREQFQSEGPLTSALLARRPQLYGEWLNNLQRVIAALPGAKPTPTKHRLADFVQLARVIGDVLGFKRAAVDAMFDRMQDERHELSVENEPFLDVLERYLQEKFPKSRCAEFDVTTWYMNLRMFAQLYGLPWTFKSPVALGIHIRQKWDGICRRVRAVRTVSSDRRGTNTYLFAVEGKTC